MKIWRPVMRQPNDDIPHSKHGDPDGIEYVVNCWYCHKKFRIHVGYSTCIFECPHCQKDNELED